MTALGVVIAVHVVAGLTAVISGAAAMLAPKRAGRHPRRGTLYCAALAVVVSTATVIAVVRWPHDNHLLALAVLAMTAAAVGYTARRVRWRGWLRHHITSMAISYIVLLTAFYVDNGPTLPLWNLLPPATFWVLPAAVGLPLLHRALRHHPNPNPAHRHATKEIPT